MIRFALGFALLFSWSAFADWSNSHSPRVAKSAACAEELQRLLVVPQKRQAKFDGLADVMRAFAHGLVPNLKQKGQRMAFAFYLATAFGSSNKRSRMPDVGFTKTNDVLKAHKQILQQPRFRNVDIVYANERMEHMPPELEQMTERLHRIARISQANFSSVAANVGFYRKILRQPDLDAATWMDENDLSILNDESESRASKNRALFKVLHAAWENQWPNRSRALGQALVDLIHNTALFDADARGGFRGARAETRLRAVKHLLQERDTLLMFDMHGVHFDQLLELTNITGPTGVTRPREIETLLANIEGRSLWAKPKEGAPVVKRTVRHLSALEKPNRSCLGGSDCSSFEYFEFGFEPGTQYYTLTDDDARSSGQVTVVLGTLEKPNGSRVQAAFLDKIQNVPTAALISMLEGIRVSLAEFGFPLYLGEDRNSHDGISNDSSTIEAYQTILALMPRAQEATFHPFATPYGFPAGYSRAYGGATFFTPFTLPADLEIHATPGEIDAPWQVDRIPEAATVRALLGMKDGDDVERGKYVSLMPSIEAAGLETAENHRALIKSWLVDPNTSARLKGDILVGFLDRLDELDPLDWEEEDDHAEVADFVAEFDALLPGLSASDREALSNRLRAKGSEAGDPECWGDVDAWIALLNLDHPERMRFLFQPTSLWKFNELLTRVSAVGPVAHSGVLATFHWLLEVPPDLIAELAVEWALHPKLKWNALLAGVVGGDAWTTDRKLDLLRLYGEAQSKVFDSTVGEIFEKASDDTYARMHEHLRARDPEAKWLPDHRPVAGRGRGPRL